MHRIRIPVLLAVFFVSFAGSCDRTDVRDSCRIETSGQPLCLAVPQRLTLEVPHKFSAKLYRIEWDVTPRTAASIRWETNDRGKRPFTNDRHALLTPLVPGRLDVTVFAFYGPQTSPQKVAVLSLTVTP